MELKLTNVARASLEELRLDYEDYLRQRNLTHWAKTDLRRQLLVKRKPKTVDEVAKWIEEVHGHNGPDGQSKRSTYPEIAANAALTLIGVASALLARQLEAQAAAFAKDGGFTERLYRTRKSRRTNT